MPAQPEVTVILPCYNAHRHLEQAVDSVRRQTIEGVEIIVINDGSDNPETLTLLETLGPDIQVIHQENRGLPGARNTGFRAASGRYVLPLDCDDWIEPDFLETSLKVLHDTPEAAFVFSNLALEDELSGELDKSYNFFEQLFLNQLPYALLLPKALWEEVGHYDETMRDGYEDWDFNIRLSRHGFHGVSTHRPLMHYRVSVHGMLKKRSSALHSALWRKIQRKNPELFRLQALFRTWRQWRGRPSTYPLWIYFFWFLLYKVLPLPAFNGVFRQVLKMSQSRRVGTTNRT
ncbi:MAG: glycosyltransferase family 2 protein [Alphaproteobacteria bacterium]|nr:glycosyltransferase family 2 protein [Alphaproteobacteria bacterium]